jgi:hypothetical protein
MQITIFFGRIRAELAPSATQFAAVGIASILFF